VSQFVQQCKDNKIPFDFVSTHHYPSDPACPKKDMWDPTCFSRNVRDSRKSVADYPFYLTEYNVGCCLGYSQHDTTAAAAFAFRQVGELNDDLDVMSYWTFTDIFEEGGFPDTEFKNIYGSMTKSGIPKPVWRAFQLLHLHAGDHRVNTTVSQPGDGFAQPTPAPVPKPYISAFSTVNGTSGDLTNLRVFLGYWGNPDQEDPPPLNRTITVTVQHEAKKVPQGATLYVIEGGGPRGMWEAMGSPKTPNATQLAALMEASEWTTKSATVRSSGSQSVISVTMSENSATVIAFK